MRHHHLAAAALLALLGACQSETEAPEANDTAVNKPGNAAQSAPAPTPDMNGPSQEVASGVETPSPVRLPPPGGLRFVGLWASEVEGCESRAWRFSENSLLTPAGSVCRFTKVTPAAGGYDIDARCTAEGPETRDALKIRFAESAQAMLFSSDAIADAGLVYCGEDG